MARLHKEFLGFDKNIKLTDARKESLKGSRKELRRKIRAWFKENKPKELQPKFKGQGSFDMNTTVNPIPVYDEDGNQLLYYDLDYGVYFIENEGEDNKRSIDTWHDWVFQAVDNHTGKDSIKKATCVRVVFADGHHVDLPIYYKDDEIPELAHKARGWIKSDPKKFLEWFNGEKNAQLEKIVRALKGWKNYRELKNTNLKLPSGFELTILATNSYVEDDNLDTAFRETVRGILDQLRIEFKCVRPTEPVEDVFADYSESRKSNFLRTLESLVNDCDRANTEKNFKKASEILRGNQFGDRFPLGEDKTEDEKSKALVSSIVSTGIVHKPYGNYY